MERADQAAREAWLRERGALQMTNVMELDHRHTTRMKEIVRGHGWPGKSMAGKDGAHAAGLLVQHATQDQEFMKQCLCLMERAVDRGEAPASEAAYLLDRVRVQEGRPQVFGTQFRDTPDG